jgi:hypothetical protein
MNSKKMQPENHAQRIAAAETLARNLSAEGKTSRAEYVTELAGIAEYYIQFAETARRHGIETPDELRDALRRLEDFEQVNDEQSE